MTLTEIQRYLTENSKMATIGTKSQRKEPKTGISWKGKMDQINLTKTIEHITTTGNNQLDPAQIKFIKRGCK